MSKNKLDAINFCRLLDKFGEESAKQTLEDVNAGRCSESTIEKYLYDEYETKDEYAKKIKSK